MSELTLEFADSEVGDVQLEVAQLRIAFSAAAVRRGDEAGHVRSLEMVLPQAVLARPLENCIGRLMDGRLWLDGVRVAPVTLPWQARGVVRLELVFENGALLSAGASALALQFTGDPGFVLSYAC